MLWFKNLVKAQALVAVYVVLLVLSLMMLGSLSFQSKVTITFFDCPAQQIQSQLPNQVRDTYSVTIQTTADGLGQITYTYSPVGNVLDIPSLPDGLPESFLDCAVKQLQSQTTTPELTDTDRFIRHLFGCQCCWLVC